MKSLYKKLALSQIKRNKNIFIPFIGTIIFLMILNSICLSISMDNTISGQSGMETMKIFMQMGVFILSIFSIIMLSSVYSFIQKRKLKESGIYLVLGLEKKHLKLILFWEMIYIMIFSIIPGLILSIILYKISLAVFVKVVSLEINIFANGIFNNILPSLCIALIFIIILILVLIIQILKLSSYTPIRLINESKAGDKKGKFRPLIALIGIIAIASGYFISITTKNPMGAFKNFFVAVLLVIIGTYCAFSVIVSIILEFAKNKKSYYKKENFFAISGLLYRVRRNSKSLSNITILSTAFIIVLTSGLSLYFGIGDAVNRMFPSNLNIKTDNFISSEQELDKYRKNIEEIAKSNKSKSKMATTATWSVPIFIENNKIRKISKEEINSMLFENKFMVLNIIYTKDTNLKFNEADLIYIKDGTVENFIDNLGFKSTGINKEDNDIPMENVLTIFKNSKIIVKDYKIADEIANKYAPINGNWKVDKPVVETMINENNESLENNLRVNIENLKINPKQKIEIINREKTKVEFLRTYGIIFFVGTILGIAFLSSMALAIYYKELTEAYEDAPRFNIMKKLGLTDEEAKKTIKKQMRTLLILPIIFASAHTAFAFPILKKFLVLMGLMNVKLFILVMVGVIALYIIIYLIILKISSRAYTKIVLYN
ncbi:FtsX-like permease family protein [Peptoniphilus sp. MSJ-1]|uniref:FtsX-like permease family protein n=1 Tax=Peptoniphilus ovalis TaxID=2841503 RepID=A0ABS6FH38_9FIRM|nr:FtsX-like permease family protein [Peptoniphilus ovalis]MBU5668566.1 FtsX-like permease family protein [Peptoniphilus ovalis]